MAGVLVAYQRSRWCTVQVQAGIAQAEVGIMWSTDRPEDQMPIVGSLFGAAPSEGAQTL